MKTERQPIHPMVKEIIEEELTERGWKDPALIIAELVGTSRHNVDRLLCFQWRLTRVQCWILDTAFGLSGGFFARLQRITEQRYPVKP